jgi:hypothetical protein
VDDMGGDAATGATGRASETSPFSSDRTLFFARRRVGAEWRRRSGRGDVDGTIEPVADGARSRVTIQLDLHGHGIGKLLLPLFVRRTAQQQMPRNLQRLKEQLERTA